jgi:hypothetical protein
MVDKLDQFFELECQPMPRSFWNRETGEFLFLDFGSRIGISELQRLACDDSTKAPTIMAAADKSVISFGYR